MQFEHLRLSIVVVGLIVSPLFFTGRKRRPLGIGIEAPALSINLKWCLAPYFDEHPRSDWLTDWLTDSLTDWLIEENPWRRFELSECFLVYVLKKFN